MDWLCQILIFLTHIYFYRSNCNSIIIIRLFSKIYLWLMCSISIYRNFRIFSRVYHHNEPRSFLSVFVKWYPAKCTFSIILNVPEVHIVNTYKKTTRHRNELTFVSGNGDMDRDLFTFLTAFCFIVNSYRHAIVFHYFFQIAAYENSEQYLSYLFI